MVKLLISLAAIMSFFMTWLLGIWFIPYLKKLNFGQTILDIGPRWHKNKEGTPTMGGLMFIISVVFSIIVCLLICFMNKDNDMYKELSMNSGNNIRVAYLISGIILALGSAAIGFLDDYIKVVKKRNLGLTAKQKTAMQFVLAAGYLLILGLNGMNNTYIPFIGYIDITSGFGLLFWPVALLFIYGFTNAVNITDGIDGLCSLVTCIVSAFYVLIFSCISIFGYSTYMMIAGAVSGGCLGFFAWNMHPAKIFMGDTGSMFFGGIIVAFAFASGMPILLIFSGILYLLEALSVVIQVSYYKKTKKRIFKMSPIHHHFEMSGWSENKIVIVFSAVTIIGCTIATILAIYG